jgi:hypothetical protein
MASQGLINSLITKVSAPKEVNYIILTVNMNEYVRGVGNKWPSKIRKYGFQTKF